MSTITPYQLEAARDYHEAVRAHRLFPGPPFDLNGRYVGNAAVIEAAMNLALAGLSSEDARAIEMLARTESDESAVLEPGWCLVFPSSD